MDSNCVMRNIVIKLYYYSNTNTLCLEDRKIFTFIIMSEMRLSHYSCEPDLKTLIQRDYDQTLWIETHRNFAKSVGFWISVDGENDWLWWSRREKHRLKRLKYKYNVTLDKKANILIISTEKELIDFNEKYFNYLLDGSIPYIGRLNDYININLINTTMTAIDWPKVAKEYQGIIITKYFHDMRFELEFMWYNAWDCTAGCIWDISAIKEIKLDENYRYEDK